MSNDAAAIGDFMADEWIIVGENGATGKADFLARVASGDATHEAMEMVGDARVRICGETAVSTARVANSGHYKGQPFRADEWTTDVFRRQEDRWLCVLSRITPFREKTES